MATISSIHGVPSPRLMGQVADTTRSTPDGSPLSSRTDTLPRTPASPVAAHEADVDLPDLTEQLQGAFSPEIRQAHSVGFRKDAATGQVIIEIRSEDGTLIKQFPSEKSLNLQRKQADLSGMVIDQKT